MIRDDENAHAKQRQADLAIELAMSGRWEEAVSANRAILQVFPNDGDSHNRLGKALMELGRYPNAKKAYKKALQLDPGNRIAKKNLDRLTVLVKSNLSQMETAKADPKLFIEESGKSAVTLLQQTSRDRLVTLNAGDQLELRPRKKTLAIETTGGDAVGLLEPQLTSRLLKLMSGGNQYAAAVTSLAGDECRVIIKETYRDPSQAGRPSFPVTVASDSTRPYTKSSLIQRGSDRVELPEAGDGDEDGDGSKAGPRSDRVAQEGTVRLNDAAAAEDIEDDDELEE